MQRGTQFMRHIGQKLGFGLVGKFGIVLGAPQISRLLGNEFGQVVAMAPQFGFCAFSFADIRVDSDDAAIRQGRAAYLNGAAVRSCSLEEVSDRVACLFDPL